LFEHERIQTTRTKAEAIRGQAERLITLAKAQ
jgi:ribosomal protein L17